MMGPDEIRARDVHTSGDERVELPVVNGQDTVRPKNNAHAVATWTFMTNHAHVLFCLEQDPTVRLREVASRVGITERAVQRIVADLQEGGYIEVSKEGRRNRYEVCRDLPLRHPVERHRTVSELLELICHN